MRRSLSRTAAWVFVLGLGCEVRDFIIEGEPLEDDDDDEDSDDEDSDDEDSDGEDSDGDGTEGNELDEHSGPGGGDPVSGSGATVHPWGDEFPIDVPTDTEGTDGDDTDDDDDDDAEEDSA